MQPYFSFKSCLPDFPAVNIIFILCFILFTGYKTQQIQPAPNVWAKHRGHPAEVQKCFRVNLELPLRRSNFYLYLYFRSPHHLQSMICQMYVKSDSDCDAPIASPWTRACRFRAHTDRTRTCGPIINKTNNRSVYFYNSLVPVVWPAIGVKSEVTRSKSLIII